MKTKNKACEIAFLSYLTALENADAEGISRFLARAETDKELETMMLDYHQEENQEQAKPERIITPFKLKREQTSRWLQRVGGSAIAALMMIMVGTVGIIIGSGIVQSPQTEISDDAALTNPSFDCHAEVKSDLNLITIREGLGMAEAFLMGVNNPFTMQLSYDAELAGYHATIEGIELVVSRVSVNIIGADCQYLRNVTVYPKDDSTRNCEITLEQLQFPMSLQIESSIGYRFPISDSFFENSALELKAFLIDMPIDGYFPIRGGNFEGKIPVEALELSEACTTFPILYRPTNFETVTNSDSISADTEIFAVERLQVTEQRFENARYLYLSAVAQIWVLTDSARMIQTWSLIDMDMFVEMLAIDTSTEVFFPPDDIFENLRLGLIPHGQAISDAQSYMADYRYEFGADGSLNHFLTSNDGTVYRLDVSSQSWSIEGN